MNGGAYTESVVYAWPASPQSPLNMEALRWGHRGRGQGRGACKEAFLHLAHPSNTTWRH